jgi:hypothetical protein
MAQRWRVAQRGALSSGVSLCETPKAKCAAFCYAGGGKCLFSGKDKKKQKKAFFLLKIIDPK